MAVVPINFVTSDYARWGAGLERVLQAAEVDRNFWEVRIAIEDLIANPPTPIEIASFAVSGVAMTITMSNGSTVGPLPLPVLAWRWRDAWLPSVPYAILDVFKVENVGIFLVLQDHSSDGSFDPAATLGGQPIYQELFAVGGLTRSTGISASGSAQSDAALLTSDWNVVSAVAAGQGVALRSGSALGLPQWIYNAGANALKVYPMRGDSAKINTQAIDAPFTIEPNSGADFRPISLTQLYSAQ